MKTKKKRRLLFQITAIVLPLFLILSGAVIWLFYRSTMELVGNAIERNAAMDSHTIIKDKKYRR